MPTREDIPTFGKHTIPAHVGGPTESRGVVVMAHGIFGDKTEGGRFLRQAELHHRLERRTVAFDWAGHGEHPVSFADATIAGNVADFEAVLRYAEGLKAGPVSVVASSFGASIFLLRVLTKRPLYLESALLLNPVTEYLTTVLWPDKGELVSAFSRSNWEALWREGQMAPQPGVTLSLPFGVELLTLRPQLGFDELTVPTRVIHGTGDQTVPFEVTRLSSERSASVDFQAIEGADHAFAAPWEERASFDLIQEWFARTHE